MPCLKLNDDITRIRMQYASKGYVRANVSNLRIRGESVAEELRELHWEKIGWIRHRDISPRSDCC